MASRTIASADPFEVVPWHQLEHVVDLHWAVETLLPRGSFAILGGAPKDGKTLLCLDLSVAIATGQPFLGCATAGAGNVLVYCAEDRPNSIRDRIQRFSDARGVKNPSISVITERELKLDIGGEGFERLRATVERHKPVLVVLDPLRRMTNVDENVSTELSPVLDQIRSLTRDFGCTLLLSHHLKKPGGEPGERTSVRLRGSSDLSAAADVLWTIQPKSGGTRLEVELREALPPEPITYRVADPLDADGKKMLLRIETVTPEIRERTLSEAILKVLAKGPQNANELQKARLGKATDVLVARDKLVASGEITCSKKGRALIFSLNNSQTREQVGIDGTG